MKNKKLITFAACALAFGAMGSFAFSQENDFVSENESVETYIGGSEETRDMNVSDNVDAHRRNPSNGKKNGGHHSKPGKPYAPPHPPVHSYTSNHTTYYSNPSESLSEMLIELIVDLLLMENLMVNYDEYPYANRDNYIAFDSSYDDLTDVYKPYRFSTDINMAYYPLQNTFATEQHLEGLAFKIFGPKVDNVIFTPNIQNGSFADMDGYFNLGGQFSVFQTNPFSLYWYVQWCHRYGVNRDDGVVFGASAVSYPVKPLIVLWDGNVTFLDKTTLYNSTVHAGCMIAKSPFELYGEWKYKVISVEYTPDEYYSGVSLGVKFHF